MTLYLYGSLSLIIFFLFYLSRTSSTLFAPAAFLVVKTAIPVIAGSLVSINFISVSASSVDYTYTISLVSLIAICLGYILYPTRALSRFHNLFARFVIQLTLLNFKQKLLSSALFLVLAVFIVLAKSNFSPQWITNPREAYENLRSGIGLFYALATWSFLLLYCTILFRFKPYNFRIMLRYSLIFSLLSLFSGSKGLVASIVIISILYFHLFIRPLGFPWLLCIALAPVIGVPLLNVLLGSANDLNLNYFQYLNSTAALVEAFQNHSLSHFSGLITIENRIYSLFPSSVFGTSNIFGIYRLHEFLNPGKLELGRATGTLFWTSYFADAGLLGVFLASFSIGFLLRFYLSVLNLFAYFNPCLFILYIQFCWFEAFNYAEHLAIILLIVILSFCGFLRSPYLPRLITV